MMYKKTASAIALSGALACGQAVANDNMAKGLDGYSVSPPLLTVGETLYYTEGEFNTSTAGAYTPPGVLDGLGAYELDKNTVRVFANHELGQGDGYAYDVSNGQGGTFSLVGARVSYLDIDKHSRDIVDGGLAYDTIYDATGNIATDSSFTSLPGFGGFSRFCSAVLVNPYEFGNARYYGRGNRRGIVDRIFFTGEEDGGRFNSVGGAEWALDVENGDIWALPDFGRGAWENITQVDTGSKKKVAFVLADDTSPFDADGDDEKEGAPLYLYVGEKSPNGNFLERNGLSGGKLYVFVANESGVVSPEQFNTAGTLDGSWVEIDNSPTGTPSADGSTGYDQYGYPTQSTLWTRAETLGAFQFSRPEDVATNPDDGSEAVLASTGRESDFNGADQFGTLYVVDTDFGDLTASLRIAYDGDADPMRTLRSPDNLDWADDGMFYVQEDKAISDGLFGGINTSEASIVRVDPWTGNAVRVAEIDRSIVLDGSIPVYTDAFDQGDQVNRIGSWESSGIIDVSSLFDERPGTLFLFDVQAHGIDDQERVIDPENLPPGQQPNPDSRLQDDDLKEGGQLLFLRKDGHKRPGRYDNGYHKFDRDEDDD